MSSTKAPANARLISWDGPIWERTRHIPAREIQAFAAEAIADGIETVLLIGQGGSTQAPMTITKYNKIDRNAVDFKVLDSVSPVRVRTILTGIDLEKTLVLVSSKSGGTIEMRSVLDAVIDLFRRIHAGRARRIPPRGHHRPRQRP